MFWNKNKPIMTPEDVVKNITLKSGDIILINVERMMPNQVESYLKRIIDILPIKEVCIWPVRGKPSEMVQVINVDKDKRTILKMNKEENNV